MAVNLVDLPDDVLLLIFLQLAVVDVLVLKQTCRVLHAVGSSDYLWHQLTVNFELPLDIPVGVQQIALASDDLQKIIMRAIRLETNWQRPRPHVERTTALVSHTAEPYVDEMYLTPGGKFLVAAQRNRQSVSEGHMIAHLTLWSLEHIEHPLRFASIETSGLYRSSALILHEGGRPAHMVVATNEQGADVLSLYSLPAQDQVNSYTTTPRTASKILTIPPHPRASQSRPAIHRIHADHDVIAITVVSFGAHVNIGDCPLEVVLANTRTSLLRWVHPRFVQPFSFIWVRLHDGYLTLLGKLHASLLLRTYKIPDTVYQDPPAACAGPADDDAFLDLGPVVAEHAESLTQNSWGIHDIATVSPASMSHLSSMTFYSFNGTQPGVGQVTRFPLYPHHFGGRGTGSFSQWFTTGSETSAEIARVGATGRRGVWLEHNWETRQKRVMKYQPIDGQAAIGVLLPPEPELPFTPSACHSLAFDEVSCRLCLGLFNGDLYVIDF